MGHNPPDITPLCQNPRSVARPDKTHRITHCRLESKISWLADVTVGHNPLVQKSEPLWQGVLNQGPGSYVRGVYVRGSWNLSFRTPFPVTENDIVHCVLILHGVMSWGFHPALPLTGVMSGGFMSANRSDDPWKYRNVYVIIIIIFFKPS